MLVDRHGRQINYVRLSMTDRCNLRCNYCLPEGFTDFLPKTELLSYEEHLVHLRVLSDLGVTKLRLTGGEPFVRRDLMSFIKAISSEKLFQEIHITTNGTLINDYIADLEQLGVNGVNLSLDTFNRENFHRITGRDEFKKVLNVFHRLAESKISLKVNAVVLPGQNIPDLLELVHLTKDIDFTMRFIEEMPFNGLNETQREWWNYEKLLHYFSEHVALSPIPTAHSSTSMMYQVPGYKGKIGIIAAQSRSFCGTCNRLRIGPKGDIRSCLYGTSTNGLKELIRSEASQSELIKFFEEVVSAKPKDGFIAEKSMLQANTNHATMAAIGG